MSLLLSGCSVGDISISRRENPTQPQSPQIISDDTNISNRKSSEDNTSSSTNENKQLNNTFPEVLESAKVGERFCVVAAADGGYLYLTLNNVSGMYRYRSRYADTEILNFCDCSVPCFYYTAYNSNIY